MANFNTTVDETLTGTTKTDKKLEKTLNPVVTPAVPAPVTAAPSDFEREKEEEAKKLVADQTTYSFNALSMKGLREIIAKMETTEGDQSPNVSELLTWRDRNGL